VIIITPIIRLLIIGHWAQVIEETVSYNYLCTYDLYRPVHNVLDACIYITRGSGRGLGPVKWHRADRRVHLGPKNLENFRENRQTSDKLTGQTVYKTHSKFNKHQKRGMKNKTKIPAFSR
jgi:hypothetical protein